MIEGFQMDRRQFNTVSISTLAGVLALAHQQALALSLGDLTNAEASQGLKLALEKGAVAAVNLLGQPDGFLGNPKVRIPLPGALEDAAKLLRNFGQGAKIDEVITTMNRAAEAAVPMSKDLLVSAVKSMSVTDAKAILSGGETSVTTFFADKTRAPLAVKFLPVVNKSVEKLGLVNQYNELAGKVADLGLVKKEDANVQKYITTKSLDGLYLMIGEEEKKIRQDPVGAGSAVLSKVFGAIK
jgi:hypothetical protein